MAKLNEDVNADLGAYQQASDILSRLIRHLMHGDADNHYGFKLTRFTDGDIKLTLRGSDIGLTGQDATLWFCFGIMKGYAPTGHHATFKRSGDTAITVFCLDDLEDTTAAAKKIIFTHPVHDVIIHELIHYFDARRNPTIGIEGSSKDKDVYFNSPIEFNAYFTNMASPLLQFLRLSAEDPEAAQRIAKGMGISTDFKTNLAMLVSRAAQNASGATKQFYAKLNPRNRRALLKRLYRLHYAVVQRLSHAVV